MNKLNLTKKDLAKKLKLTEKTLNKKISGEKPFRLNEAIERNFIKLNIDDNLKMNESDWCLGKKITMQYLTQVLSVINAIIDYYSRNSYVQILCNHYKEINVYETYSIENNTKFLSLKFVTSSGKLIIIKNPTIEMDTRIGKLIAITGDSSVNQDEIEIIY